MIIVGLDLSLRRTGLAGATWTRSVTSEGHLTDSTSDRAWRMSLIRDEILGAVQDAKAELVIIEGPAIYAQRGMSDHLMAGLWWLVVVSMAEVGLRIVQVPPKNLKLYLTGKGGAKKPDVVRAVRELFPRHNPKDDNEADALGLVAMGYDWAGTPLAVIPKAQRDNALESVVWSL